MKTNFFIPILAMFIVVLSSCDPDEIIDIPSPDEAKATEEFVEVQAEFESAFAFMDSEAQKQGGLHGLTQEPVAQTRTGCADYTFTPTPDDFFPAVATMSWEDGCTTQEGKPISGMIKATYDGLLLSKGTSITIEFMDFKHDGQSLSGTWTVINDGMDDQGILTFLNNVEGTFENREGENFTYKSERIAKMIEGFDTNWFTDGQAGVTDDVWSWDAITSLTNNTIGETYNGTTPEVLIAPEACDYVTQGIYKISKGSANTEMATIDFGDGTCDNKATLTVGVWSGEIDL